MQSPAGEVGAEGYAEVAQVRAVPVWDGTGDYTAESDRTYASSILGESTYIHTYVCIKIAYVQICKIFH